MLFYQPYIVFVHGISNRLFPTVFPLDSMASFNMFQLKSLKAVLPAVQPLKNKRAASEPGMDRPPRAATQKASSRTAR